MFCLRCPCGARFHRLVNMTHERRPTLLGIFPPAPRVKRGTSARAVAPTVSPCSSMRWMRRGRRPNNCDRESTQFRRSRLDCSLMRQTGRVPVPLRARQGHPTALSVVAAPTSPGVVVNGQRWAPQWHPTGLVTSSKQRHVLWSQGPPRPQQATTGTVTAAMAATDNRLRRVGRQTQPRQWRQRDNDGHDGQGAVRFDHDRGRGRSGDLRRHLRTPRHRSW